VPGGAWCSRTQTSSSPRSVRRDERDAVPDRKRPAERRVVLEPDFIDDLIYWIETDFRVAIRLAHLVREIRRTPFTGTGKPELLKHRYRGCWSRRLTDSHRLLYKVTEDAVYYLAARFHYDDD
jgi:toxin YoeB